MEKLMENNRELALKNQDLRLQLNLLLKERNFLSKCLIEERIAHGITKKQAKKYPNTSIEYLSPNTKEEDSCLTQSEIRSPQQSEFKNITVRRKKREISNNLPQVYVSEYNENNQGQGNLLFPDVNNRLLKNITTATIKSAIDNEDVLQVRENLVSAEDINNIYLADKELLTISEEHLSQCQTLSVIESNHSQNLSDTNEFSMENVPCSTPNNQKSLQKKKKGHKNIIEHMMNRKLKVRIKRIKINDLLDNIITPLNSSNYSAIIPQSQKIVYPDFGTYIHSNSSAKFMNNPQIEESLHQIGKNINKRKAKLIMRQIDLSNNIFNSPTKSEYEISQSLDYITSQHSIESTSFNGRPKRKVTTVNSYVETKINQKMRNCNDIILNKRKQTKKK